MQSVKMELCSACLKYYVMGKDHYCTYQGWTTSEEVNNVLLKAILEELKEIKGLLCQQTEMMEKLDLDH